MIRFQNVSKSFGSERPALNSVSFAVQPGEFVLLTGHSGSGKSTLLKLITREYYPTNGDIEFNDTSLNDLRRSQLHHHRRQIGVIYQDYRLLPELNVWENIALPLEIIGKSQSEIEERVTDLLELVGLTEKAYDFPSQLSGGEAQRVGIARALGTAPKVLLADEPTGNLDPESTMMISKLFDKIHDLGTTIIVATHDLSILSDSKHRQLHLEKGQLKSDTPAKGGSAKTAKPKTETVPKSDTKKHDDAQASEDEIEDDTKTQPKSKWQFRFPWQKKTEADTADEELDAAEDTLKKNVSVHVEEL